ncbi:hypothetical protein Afil01_24550 [Actinorhabdospora filicis]|uniref:Uncharacterized protein n=1 Tax=Actinorhabdospora filicis TaxID=1785913 RepID=A0A9W6W951_9ACTN|nr:hypothetical protein [Actinorhabdospora filicis]GLZ77648.1 hypothetical protein Afil01_24550 [Actinorhabdospora filicis]
METNAPSARPTPEQARAALAEAAQIRTSVTAVAATPWPVWFTVVITAMFVILPIAIGGVLAEPEWLMSKGVWLGVLLASETTFCALLAVASKSWQAKTGVALRWNVLPKAVTIPGFLGLAAVLIGSGYVFRYTGQPIWLFVASGIGAAASIASHIVFTRLHRKSA